MQFFVITRQYKVFLLMFWLVAHNVMVYGQSEYEVSYKAGLVFKIVSPTIDIDSDLVSIPNEGNEIGYQIGAFTRIRVNNIYIQPELLLANIQHRIELLDYNGISGFDPPADFEFTTLEVPLSIGVNIGNLRLDAGPGFSILLKGSQYFLQEKTSVTREYNHLSLLWRFGLGVDLKALSVDFKYEFGLSKTAESLDRLVDRSLFTRQSQLVFSIAYSFIKD